MTQDQIKFADFHHPVMTWTKTHHPDPANPYPHELSDEAQKQTYDAQILDLRVWASSGELFDEEYLPDPQDQDQATDTRNPGVYDFYFDDEFNQPHQCPNRFHGIVVTPDGLFDPHLSAHAIYIARVGWLGTTEFEEVYIDRIFWSEDSDCFGVMVES